MTDKVKVIRSEVVTLEQNINEEIEKLKNNSNIVTIKDIKTYPDGEHSEFFTTIIWFN